MNWKSIGRVGAIASILSLAVPIVGGVISSIRWVSPTLLSQRLGIHDPFMWGFISALFLCIVLVGIVLKIVKAYERRRSRQERKPTKGSDIAKGAQVVVTHEGGKTTITIPSSEE